MVHRQVIQKPLFPFWYKAHDIKAADDRVHKTLMLSITHARLHNWLLGVNFKQQVANRNFRIQACAHMLARKAKPSESRGTKSRSSWALPEAYTSDGSVALPKNTSCRDGSLLKFASTQDLIRPPQSPASSVVRQQLFTVGDHVP